MKSKWFTFEGKEFRSKRRAKTKSEAVEKSLEKWGLKPKGYKPYWGWDDSSTCGFCDLCNCHCRECLIFEATGTDRCLTLQYEPEPQLLFFLFVKEATK